MTTSQWREIAAEGDTVELPAQSRVRYGESIESRFVERIVGGLVAVTNDFFGGDPAPDMRKRLWLMESAAVPAPQPAPAPQPPAEVPKVPSITDPDFDRKVCLLELAQRERSLAATIRLAAANESAAQRYADVIAEFGRLLAFLRSGASNDAA